MEDAKEQTNQPDEPIVVDAVVEDVPQEDALPAEEPEPQGDEPAADEPAPEAADAAEPPAPVDDIEAPIPLSRPIEPERRKRGRGIMALIIIVVIIAIVYVGGVVGFSFYFMPNALLNGEDVSLKTTGEVADASHKLGTDYETHIEGDNVSLDIVGHNIGVKCDGEQYAAEAIGQLNKWLWPLEIFVKHDITQVPPVTFNEAVLDDRLKEAVKQANVHAEAPVDATIKFDKDKGSFAIKREVIGTTVDYDKTRAVVVEGITELRDSIELGHNELKLPTVYSTDERLVKAVDDANAYVKRSVDLTVNGKKVYTLAPKVIASWVHLNDELAVEFDSDAVTEWARGPLSKKFDTVKSKRSYKRADGKKVTVEGGTYGWVINGGDLAKQLVPILTGESEDKGPVEIPMYTTGRKWNPGGADWGRYIDVDITEQHVRLYDANGKILWESDCVTGKDAKGRRTPTGVYTVWKKGRNETLVGADEDHDGEPDYESDVSYWMPFVDNWVGLHDADWRSAFGGAIYKNDGSHGCVNLPPSKAAQLYGLIEVGEVVSCHY